MANKDKKQWNKRKGWNYYTNISANVVCSLLAPGVTESTRSEEYVHIRRNWAIVSLSINAHFFYETFLIVFQKQNWAFSKLLWTRESKAIDGIIVIFSLFLRCNMKYVIERKLLSRSDFLSAKKSNLIIWKNNKRNNTQKRRQFSTHFIMLRNR